MTARLVSVAVPVPALGLLTYSIPDSCTVPVPGARVVVPLGSRRLTGVVTGEAATPDGTFAVRDVLEVLDRTAFLPGDVVQLTDWVAEYYLAGPGATLAAAMPPYALSPRGDRFRTVRVVTLTPAGLDCAERKKGSGLFHVSAYRPFQSNSISLSPTNLLRSAAEIIRAARITANAQL